MSALAKIFHDLPELSGEFKGLLKDLMKSAPDESRARQVEVAANLTDTPVNEALRRVAGYLDYGNRAERIVKAPDASRIERMAIYPRSSMLSGESAARAQYGDDLRHSRLPDEWNSWERQNRSSDPWVAKRARIERRLGRQLNTAEDFKLGDDMAQSPLRFEPGGKATPEDSRLWAIDILANKEAPERADVVLARQRRERAQAMMALEYFLKDAP